MLYTSLLHRQTLCKLIRSILFMLLLSIGLAQSGQTTVVPHPGYVEGEVLVGIDADADNIVTQTMLSSVGTITQTIEQIHGYRLQLAPDLSIANAILRLQLLPGVLYAEPNIRGCVGATPNDTSFSSQPGFLNVTADKAWNIWHPSRPVVIAIVDTGINNTHPDLTDKIFKDSNNTIIGCKINKNGSTYTAVQDDAADDNGHGTRCAGLAAARTNNTTGIAGIAGWNGFSGPLSELTSDTTYVKLMPIKVFYSDGTGDIGAWVAGIMWAADHGANVINMTLRRIDRQ